MNENPHFTAVEDWPAAAELIGFEPLRPNDTAGFTLDSLSVHVMDHRMRRLPPEECTLEAHYGGFVFTQSGPGAAEARRLAYDSFYGPSPLDASVGTHAARAYDEGPVPEPDDPDGQMPALVVWQDGDRFFLLAGAVDGVDVPVLLRVANSIYG